MNNKKGTNKTVAIILWTLLTIISLATLLGVTKTAPSSPTIQALAVACGFLTGLGVVGLITTLIKRGNSSAEYDERQMAVRGKAYQCGFIFYMAWFVIKLCLASAEIALPMDDAMDALLGMFLGLLAMTTYAIWNDAYVGVNQNMKNTCIMLACVAIANLLIGISNASHKEVIVDGVLTYRAINIVVGVMFIYLLIVFSIKMLKDKKEAANEES